MSLEQENVMERMKAIQRNALIAKYGPDFENILRKNNKDEVSVFISRAIEAKSDLTPAEKIDVEIAMQNLLYETEVPNSEFECPSDWLLINNAYKKYKELNPDYTAENDICFGTISSDEINASADEDLILFDGELFIAALLLAKVVAQSLPLNPNPPYLTFPVNLSELEKKLSNQTTIFRTIGCFYFSIYKRPSVFPAYRLNDDVLEHFSIQLMESIELFIFSHEMRHCLSKDTEKKGATTEELWHQEFTADLYGQNQIVKLYERENRNELILLGPEIYFRFQILREKQLGATLDNDHPSTFKRLEMYREFLYNFIPLKEMSKYCKYQDLLDRLFEFYEIQLNNFISFKSELVKT